VADICPGGQGDDPTRAELRLERQAVRNDWPIPAAVRTKVLQRLIDYLDRDHDEGATAPDRTILMAARTLAQFARLNVDQQKLDLELRRAEMGAGEVDLAELVAEAERRAEERQRTRAADGPPGTDP
jgi:hypothetical protein